ncbi:hypothetical protein TNCT_679441 [Trichonephila clavata]|uniref:Uncharacterized protein n=1 Tax=Trichonephila clavata TaxID=2740835 RepID=A0A8X6GB60_TRICU|nr:hypothetical protein TNCT_679441 [Trichonephila clavata]
MEVNNEKKAKKLASNKSHEKNRTALQMLHPRGEEKKKIDPVFPLFFRYFQSPGNESKADPLRNRMEISDFQIEGLKSEHQLDHKSNSEGSARPAKRKKPL